MRCTAVIIIIVQSWYADYLTHCLMIVFNQKSFSNYVFAVKLYVARWSDHDFSTWGTFLTLTLHLLYVAPFFVYVQLFCFFSSVDMTFFLFLSAWVRLYFLRGCFMNSRHCTRRYLTYILNLDKGFLKLRF